MSQTQVSEKISTLKNLSGVYFNWMCVILVI